MIHPTIEQIYREKYGLNYSLLADFITSPDHALMPRENKSHFEFGKAFELALYDEVYGTNTIKSRFFDCVAPGKMPKDLAQWIEAGEDLEDKIKYNNDGSRSGTNKRLHSWIDECLGHPGKMPLSHDEQDMLDMLLENTLKATILGSPAKEILESCDWQKPIYWESEGIKKKALLDLFLPGDAKNYLFDIKTSENLANFKRMLSTKYWVQDCHYHEGCEALFGKTFAMIFLVATKTPPHLFYIQPMHSQYRKYSTEKYREKCREFVAWDRKPVGWQVLPAPYINHR